MKRILVLLVAVMMVVGFSGQAMAYFNQGDLVLTLYTGEPDETEGAVLHFDLGMGEDYATAYSIDTGITAADLDASTWEDVKVAVLGGLTTDMGFAVVWGDNPLFTSDTDSFDVSDNRLTAYQSGIFLLSDQQVYISGDDQLITFAKDEDPYLTYLSGSYGSFAIAQDGTSYGLEAVMDATGELSLAMYGYSGADEIISLLGTFTFDLDEGDSTLLVSYNPVPVPGAFILLGSALLGMVGIRRKKA